MTAMEEAVKAVILNCSDYDELAARIAKGIERVVIACVPEPWPSALQLSTALKAFKEEST